MNKIKHWILKNKHSNDAKNKVNELIETVIKDMQKESETLSVDYKIELEKTRQKLQYSQNAIAICFAILAFNNTLSTFYKPALAVSVFICIAYILTCFILALLVYNCFLFRKCSRLAMKVEIFYKLRLETMRISDNMFSMN